MASRILAGQTTPSLSLPRAVAVDRSCQAREMDRLEFN
jgi:hypothetical protein